LSAGAGSAATEMRILGVDCGTERTGYGVISSDGRRHQFIAAGVIRARASVDLGVRLARIAGELRQVCGEYRPEIVAVEEVFHAANAKSSLKLAHVRGVVLLVAAEAGLPLGEYSPLEVKMSVVGYGRAEKQQVQMMVRSLLQIETEMASHDVSDALAVAICHATRAPYAAAIEAHS
jgi:crossover junction endodeoxyribonuclease RuvC